MFSADNAQHPQNNLMKMSHDQVLNHLFHSGYDAHEIKGKFGTPLRSIIIYQIDPKQAEELHKMAARLGQNHSIYSNGMANEMRFHHGSYAGRSHYGEDVSYHEVAPEDNYHTLPGGMNHFTHNFNYDSQHMAGQLDKWGKCGY